MPRKGATTGQEPLKMPELPEIETIRKQLECLIVGKKISSIEVLNPGSFRADKDGLIGKTVTGVGRKGKVLIIKQQATSNRQQDFYVHLKMSGQLEFIDKTISNISKNISEKAWPFLERPGLSRLGLSRLKHLRVAITFSDNSCLLFHDQRKFGWISDDPAILPAGIDVLDPWLSSNKLAKIIASSSRPIKQILLDQSKIAGIGNIYASEILWEAEISPFRKVQKGCTLPRQGATLMHTAINKVLTEAIDAGGSTMADGLYRQTGGQAGDYWPRRRVYDREGQLCRRPACKKAGAVIQKTVIGQRSTYWCPSCQL